jgi:hypothetical protein
MQRRKFLTGVGALAASSAAAVGTGAFASETDGALSVDVVGPAGAYMGVDPNTSSEYVSESSPVAIDLAGDSTFGGSGVPESTDTLINPAFVLENNSSGTMYVEIDNPLSNNDISTSSQAGPAGVDVQFLTAPSLPLRDFNGKGGVALIGRNNKVQGNGNGLGAGFDDPGSNEYYFHQGPNDTSKNAPNRTVLTQGGGKSAAGALEIQSGESYPVVFRVATQEPGNVDLDAQFQIEAYDTESNLTYDNIVNTIWPGEGPAE